MKRSIFFLFSPADAAAIAVTGGTHAGYDFPSPHVCAIHSLLLLFYYWLYFFFIIFYYFYYYYIIIILICCYLGFGT